MLTASDFIAAVSAVIRRITNMALWYALITALALPFE